MSLVERSSAQAISPPPALRQFFPPAAAALQPSPARISLAQSPPAPLQQAVSSPSPPLSLPPLPALLAQLVESLPRSPTSSPLRLSPSPRLHPQVTPLPICA